MDGLVDPDERTVSGRVFSDPAVFVREQRTVFARSWLCLGHRSQLKERGDFVQTYAGAIPMLLCLADGGRYHAIANVCAHRGARICQLERGRAERFACPYHHWTFDNKGELAHVPRGAPPGFDHSRWHLQRAAKVDTYRDLIFVCFDPDAPSLEDYLGDMRWYLDLVLMASGSGTVLSAGAHRSILHCNWKIPAEQFGADNWHFQAVHGSLARLGRRNEDPLAEDSFHAWMPQGHMLIAVAPRTEVPTPYTFYLDELLARGRITPQQRRLLRCALVMTVFPNLSFVYFPGMCSMRLWQPRAADKTELWSWALADVELPEPLQKSNRQQVTRSFSPTGMLEQDDLEVWVRLASNLATMPPDFRLCYAFDAEDKHGERPYPGRTAGLQSDRPAFAFYEAWARAMELPEATVA